MKTKMRKLAVLFLVLVFGAVCSAADITNLAQLKTAASTGGTYTIAPGTYTLDADLTFAVNITITHDGNTGDVIIDGVDAYKSIVQNCTATFVGQSDTKRIIFTQGDDHTLQIQSTTAATMATFSYCDFSEAKAGNDLNVAAGNAATITATFNDCNAFNGSNDGFALAAGTVNYNIKIYLNNCTSHDHLISTSDGATAHEQKEYIYINGGNYYNNGKAGVDGSDCSSVEIIGATFYDNGFEAAATGQVGIQSILTSLKVDHCTFSTVCETDRAGYGINAIYCKSASITNNIFTGTGVYASGATILVGGSGGIAIIRNNVISGNQGTNAYGIYTGTSLSSVEISNNVIYNCERGIRLGITASAVFNNIFMSCDGLAAVDMDVDDAYKNDLFTGYNCFYNNTANFYDRGGGGTADQKKATDITADPQFVDVANGDFRLKATSPCLNTGKTTLNDGKTTIGAWQPAICESVPSGDLNNNFRVDFYDFAQMASNWLIDCTTDPDNPACVPE
jgi:hypothetical protein